MYIYDVPTIWHRSITFSLFTLVRYHETVRDALWLDSAHLFLPICRVETPLVIRQHTRSITQMSELTNSQLCTRPLTVKPKDTVQGLKHLLRIREVSGPNRARYTGYTNICNDFPPVPSDK